KLRSAIAEELTEFLDEGEDSRTHHDMVNHIRVARNLRQVAREGRLGWRDWHHGDNLAALRLDRGGEIVPVIVPERVVGIDQGDLLAEVLGDPGCDGTGLRFHVSDARLDAVAVHLAGRDMVAFANDIVRHFQLAGSWRGTNDNVREQCAVDEINLVLANEFLHDLGAASGIGAIIFYEDLQRSAVAATRLINELHGSSRGAVIPAAIGSADAGTVALDADTDRLGRLSLRIAHETGRGEQRTSSLNSLQCCAPGQSVACLDTVPDVVHSLPCSLILK